VDPIGACVGQKGVRIQNVIRELNGEMIDVIEWNEDHEKFIRSSLAPAKITSLVFHETQKRASIFVSTDQRPLAIGKQGQNVKLASELTGYELDIRDVAEYQPVAAPLASEPSDTPEEAAERALPMDIPADKDGLENLDVGEAVQKKLLAAGVATISQLQRMSEGDLTQIGGIGKGTATKIVSAVSTYKKTL